MIAGCPTCAARYRIDAAKLRPEGARLRCSRCETVFRVQPEAEAVAPVALAASPAPSRAAPAAPPRVVPTVHPTASRSVPAQQPGGDPEKRVLIAHPDVEAGKAVADALTSWGLAPLLVHDGVEAMLQIQRTLPRVVVLDAALPKMFGFQICEIMKRNEQLRVIPVVLIGAVHDQDRYRRPPEDLYGADAYIERQELPDALVEHLVRFGIRPAPAAPPAPPRAARPAPSAPAPTPAPTVARPAAPSAAEPAPAANPEIEKANRLARIIVSDVILYNPEKFAAAVRAGDVLTALSAELEEGVSLFASRVDARVCDPRELLQRELVRVARSRGMK
jgi:predicted Zn finger-like uncharacterized protein